MPVASGATSTSPGPGPAGSGRSVTAITRTPSVTTARINASRRRSSPDLSGGLDDQVELGDLLVARQCVALDGRGEPTLPRQAQLLDRDVLGGLVDAPLEQVLALELGPLGRDQPQNHELVLGHEPQRLKA